MLSEGKNLARQYACAYTCGPKIPMLESSPGDRSDSSSHEDEGGPPPSSVLSPELRPRLQEALGLSPREFEIALAIMDGFTGHEIAESLGSSPHTVASHVRRIFRKLGVNNRASIVARVLVAFANLGRG